MNPRQSRLGVPSVIILITAVNPEDKTVIQCSHPSGTFGTYRRKIYLARGSAMLPEPKGMDSAREERHYQVVQAGSVETFVLSNEVYFRTSAPLWSG